MALDKAREADSFDEYNEALLDKKAMQELQDKFCLAQRVYAQCFSRTRGVITEPYGKEEELSFLHQNISAETHMTLLQRLVASPYENVQEAETDRPWLRCCGLAVRVKGAIVALWVILGVIGERLGEQELPEGLRTTTDADFDRSLEFLETLSKNFLTARMDELFAEEATKRVLDEKEEYQRKLKRNEAVTNIVLMQESDNSFSGVVNDILEQAVTYLELTHAGLWRISRDEETVDMIAEYSTDPNVSFVKKVRRMPVERVPFLTGKPYMISSDSAKPQDFDRFFKEFHVEAAVSLPVEVQGRVGMYLTFFEGRKERIWDVNDIKFLNDVRQIIQSILQRRIARNSLASSYASLEAVLENAGSALLVEEPEERKILFLNRAFKDMFPESGRLKSIRDIFYPEPIPTENSFTEVYSASGKRWFDVRTTPITWVDGTKVHLYTIVEATERKRLIQELERELDTDALTGLHNRRRCERTLDQYIREYGTSGDGGALILINIDDFKHINDGIGHNSGDILLKQVAQDLLKLPGVENNCYRLEGDTYAIVLTDHQIYLLNDVVEELRSMFVRPWYLNGEDYYCNMCLAIVRFPEDADNAKEIMAKAEVAMNDAKRNGKNRISRYNDAVEMTDIRRSDMERCLKEAVENRCEEFEIYFQPVTDIREGMDKCLGAEALLRWNSPELGLVSPADFIPMAEYLGFMGRIGGHVLHEALLSLRYWNDYGHPDFSVSINLSALQLLQSDIVETVSKVLRETGVVPENVTLDVTEAMSVSDLARMKRVLADLRRLGVKVALDDFGIGNSSLNHIRELPIDQIKIDRSFVRDIHEDKYSAAFVRLVAELAHTIGLTTVVEGVETEEQLKELRDIGTEFIQGYYFGKPMTREAFEEKYI